MSKQSRRGRPAKHQRRRRLTMGEQLEAKKLMAADASISYDAASDTIHIVGSDFADEVVVSHNDHGTPSVLDDTIDVEVSYDKAPLFPWGQTTKSFSQNLNALKVSGFPPVVSIEQIVDKVRFEGGTGDDDFNNTTNVPSEAFGQAGDDVLRGGSAGDHLDGGTGDDALYGRAGNDFLTGYSGDDYLSGGSGNDVMFGRSGADRMFGGSGNDSMSGGTGEDEMHGGSGDDSMTGDGGSDEMHGGAGDDSLSGVGGNDELHGDDGADTLNGGIGEDRLDGGQDGDVDTLTGGPGVYTDMFFEEGALQFIGNQLKWQNKENFTDFNMFNDIDVKDSLIPSLSVDYTLPSEIGDVNANGVTDLSDFNILKSNMNTNGERNDGDLTGDGKVNLADFNVLKAHFGETADYDFEKIVIVPLPPVIVAPFEPLDPLPELPPFDPRPELPPIGPIDPPPVLPPVLDPVVKPAAEAAIDEVLIGLDLPSAAPYGEPEGDEEPPLQLRPSEGGTEGLLLPAVQKVR